MLKISSDVYGINGYVEVMGCVVCLPCSLVLVF